MFVLEHLHKSLQKKSGLVQEKAKRGEIGRNLIGIGL